VDLRLTYSTVSRCATSRRRSPASWSTGCSSGDGRFDRIVALWVSAEVRLAGSGTEGATPSRQARAKTQRCRAGAAAPQPATQPLCTTPLPLSLPRCLSRMVSPTRSAPAAPPKPKPAHVEQLPVRIGQRAGSVKVAKPQNCDLQCANAATQRSHRGTRMHWRTGT
jgi:hypothetical protein